MSATDILRYAESNALRIAQAPHLAYELTGTGNSGNVEAGSGSGGYTERDSFLENSGRTGFYKGNNSPKGFARPQNKFSLKGKGKFKKIMAALVLTALIGGGTFLASSNTMLPSALVSLVTSQTNLQETSLNARTITILGRSMRKGSAGDGFVKAYQLTPKVTENFTKNGFEVSTSGSKVSLKFGDSTIDSKNFRSFYNNNVEFRDAYSKSVNVRANSFFDKSANNYYQAKIRASRNDFKDYKETDDPEENRKNFDDTRSKAFEGDSTDVATGGKTTEKVQELDADGNPILENGQPKYKDVEIVSDNSTSSSVGKGSKAEAQTKAKSYIEGVSSKVSSATHIGDGICTILKTATAVSLAISALDMYQSIKFALQLMESPSKAIAGQGETSAIHANMNWLTEKVHSETSDLNNVKVTGSGDDITTEAGTIVEEKAPIEAEGMQLILANAQPNMQKVDNYSIEKSQKTIFSTMSLTGASVAGCAMNSLVGGIVSLGVTLAAGPIKVVAASVTKTVTAIAKNVFLMGLIAFLVPTLAQIFLNPIETVGLPGGEQFAKGISASNYKLGTATSANSPASAEEVAAYNRETETRLALEAETDRLNHSPFDITNRNTFLGSIAYSMLPMISSGSGSSSMRSLTTITRTTSKALASLTGNVYASGDSNSYSSTFGDCPNLTKIGAVGDIYCNAITISDSSTRYMEPDDEIYQKVMNAVLEGCDSNGGNCKVKKDSNLELYIKHCMNRESPPGVLDNNILDDLKKTGKLGSAGVIASGIPIVGDIMSIIDGIDELDPENQAWADNSICVNNSSNKYWDSEFKYYQRYLEDMRILEQWGVQGVNVAEQVMQEYYTENPLDNSPSGYLARISGLSKDDADTVIALVEYYDFIKDYDPSSRIAMEDGVVKTATQIVEQAQRESDWQYDDHNTDNKIAKAVLIDYIVYADVRNRNYAA